MFVARKRVSVLLFVSLSTKIELEIFFLQDVSLSLACMNFIGESLFILIGVITLGKKWLTYELFITEVKRDLFTYYRSFLISWV